MLLTNAINIPVSNLHLPSYNADDPLAPENYGRLGATIGHELGHAFDSEGVEWVLAYQSRPLFGNGSSLHRSAYLCLVEQYSAFCPLAGTNYSEQCVDGGKTVGENWADAVGIRLAYDAYERRLAMAGKAIDDVP